MTDAEFKHTYNEFLKLVNENERLTAEKNAVQAQLDALVAIAQAVVDWHDNASDAYEVDAITELRAMLPMRTAGGAA